MQRVLLAAAVGGLSASFLNPPIEIPRLRGQVAKAFDSTAMPQVLLRLGYGASIPPAPRRAVREVLTLSLPAQ